MLRFSAVLATALVLVPAASAGGNNPAGLQDDVGALNSQANIRYVASKDGANSMITALSTKDGSVLKSVKLQGKWGIPRIDQGASLSFDGKTLVLAKTALGSPTTIALTATARVRSQFLDRHAL